MTTGRATCSLGAGHTVTVLYEIVPKGVAIGLPAIDPLKYMTPAMPRDPKSGEIFTLKLRYKEPDGNQSERLDNIPHKDWGASYRAASPDFRFAMAVAAYGMILGDSEYKGILSFNTVLEIADGAVDGDRRSLPRGIHRSRGGSEEAENT